MSGSVEAGAPGSPSDATMASATGVALGVATGGVTGTAARVATGVPDVATHVGIEGDSEHRTPASVRAPTTPTGPVHRTHVYGDNVDTDRLFPGRYLFAAKDEDIRAHALEDLDPAFRERVAPGDVVVGGANFGCGSSREQAVACLRLWGVRHVVARSFARIYFRNAVNNGVAPIVCPDHRIEDGDQIAFDGAELVNLSKGERYACEPLPGFLQEIVDAGGLVAHMRST